MDGNGRTILVAGATGQQGSASARHLLEDGWRVRAVTRDASKPGAQALFRMGAEVIEANMEDQASLDRVLQGIYGVYSVQNFWLPGVGFDGEVRQGKNMADAARAAGVQHFVYSSVGGAERNSGIPHFESKWIVEGHIRGLGLPATILRPVFFMDNLNYSRQEILKEGTIKGGMRPDEKLQMVAVDDVGAFVAMAFSRPQDFIGRAIELAGDELTYPEMADVLSRVMSRPIHYVQIPLDVIRQASEENAKMVAWFNDQGYKADISYLRTLRPEMLSFEAWLQRSGWDRMASEKAA
ncbi:MAG TPA: NmrA/HSCARG family protein [Chloroflexota bacterium]|nr:NmrA/HSCARG family protein [Chloroflexota bacterium]